SPAATHAFTSAMVAPEFSSRSHCREQDATPGTIPRADNSARSFDLMLVQPWSRRSANAAFPPVETGPPVVDTKCACRAALPPIADDTSPPPPICTHGFHAAVVREMRQRRRGFAPY